MPIRMYDPSEPSLAAQFVEQEKFAQYQAAATPQLAQQITSMVQTYPNMRPGTALSLAQAQVDPAGPIAAAAAKAEAKKRQKKGFGWHSIGDLVAGGFGKVGDAVGAVADPAYDVLKGASRGAFIGLQAIPETFQGAMRESVADGDISGAEWLLGLPHLGKGFQQTTMAAGLDEISREGVGGADYGSGFFAGGDVKKIQVQRARAAAPLINNRATTIGRYTAKQFIEPGGIAYSTLSGLIDAAVMLGGDPTTFVGGSSRRAIEARKGFVGSKGDVVIERAVEMTPAKLAAKEFGEGAMNPSQFLDRARQFGSDNPSVTSTVRSLDEGLLDEADALARLEDLRPRIAVEAGLVEGTRKTVLSDTAFDWLSMNKQGRAVVKYLATEQSVAQMRRATKGQVDTETLVKLSAAQTEDEVISVLGPRLGKQIRQKFGVSAADQALAEASGQGGNATSIPLAARIKKAKASSRWLAMNPHNVMDLEDLDDAVDQVSRIGRSVKMSLDDEDAFVNRMALTTNRNERLTVAKDLMRKVQEDVLPPNMPAKDRKALTKLFDDEIESAELLRTFSIDELGKPQLVPGAPVKVMIDGKTEVAPSPHLLSEHVGQYLPLPDARALRRETSKAMATLGKIPGARRASDGLIIGSSEITKVFKVGALMRLAYPIRVIAEEQIRLSASGMHSAFVHPKSYIAIVTGKAGHTDIRENPFDEAMEFGDAMNAGSAGMVDQPGKVKLRGKVVVRRDSEQFTEALVDNLSELHNSPLAKRLANGGLLQGDRTPNPLPGVDGVKDWFFNGAGRGERRDLATGADNAGAPASREKIFNTKFDPNDPLNSSDGYVDSMVERLRNTTGGDPRLMKAIAEGKIDGVPFVVQTGPKQFKVNKAAVAKMNEILAEGPNVGPQYAKADPLMRAKGHNDPSFADIGRGFDKFTEWMFEGLMAKPTNYLSRSPAFGQFYWKRQGELIEHMDAAAQVQTLKAARAANLDRGTLAKLEAGAARRKGALTLDEADNLGKAFGLDSTRKLLYDLHDRNQFFDAMRVVFPFGEAWKEVMTTWARIGVKENPVALRRAQVLVNGLRNTNLDGEDEGMFYTNANGEEAFAIPFSGWINEQVTGVDAQFVAPVKSLNLWSSSVIPGLGPVITMPLGKLIPNRPEYDDAMKLLMPFGEKEYTDGALGGFSGSLLPTWFQKARTAFADPEKDRIFANNVAYSARYLASTGKYDMNSPEGKDKLEQDSIKAARKLYLLRALAQVWSPAPPSPEYVTLDETGEGLVQARLVEEYVKLQNEDYKTATQKFVEKFGEGALLTTVARTQGGAPPTESTNDFIRENPEVVRQFGKTYGYFMERGGEFSYAAYRAQLATGERKTITPKQALEVANQRIGNMVYQQYKQQVGDFPTKEQKAWLSTVRDAIEEKYPGYNPTPGNLRDQKLLIAEMIEAAENPVLSNTEAGRGLQEYLEFRDEAMAVAQSRGLQTFFSAKKAKDLREALREKALVISEQYPAFEELFDRTFNREMVADGDE